MNPSQPVPDQVPALLEGLATTRTIRRYLDETTPFPKDRETKEVSYTLSPDYKALFDDVLAYMRKITASQKMATHYEIDADQVITSSVT